MIFAVVLWLLAAFMQPPAPVLIGASFTSSTSAAISWEQPPNIRTTCLRIYHTGAEWPAGICWDNLPEGAMRVDLPGIYTHPAYRPQYGDRLVVAFGMQDVGSAVLGESVIYTTYLPLVQQNAPLMERVYVAVVRG